MPIIMKPWIWICNVKCKDLGRANDLLPEYKTRAAEGLSKLLAYLRERHEEDRQEELRKLIPVGQQVNEAHQVSWPAA